MTVKKFVLYLHLCEKYGIMIIPVGISHARFVGMLRWYAKGNYEND